MPTSQGDNSEKNCRTASRLSVFWRTALSSASTQWTDAVDFKHVLCQIQADTYDLHGMSPSSGLISEGSPIEGGGVHTIGSRGALAFGATLA